MSGGFNTPLKPLADEPFVYEGKDLEQVRNLATVLMALPFVKIAEGDNAVGLVTSFEDLLSDYTPARYVAALIWTAACLVNGVPEPNRSKLIRRCVKGFKQKATEVLDEGKRA